MIPMAVWGHIKQDLLAGVNVLTSAVSRAAQRSGRELALIEQRMALMKIESELLRRYRELGESAYERWRQGHPLEPPVMREAMEEIAALAAQREGVRRDLSDDEGAAPHVRPAGAAS